MMMVGAHSSGKTTLMINGSNYFLKNVANNNGLIVDEDYSWRIIDECNRILSGSKPEPSSNSITTYSMKFDSEKHKSMFKTPKSIYYYDISGSVYSNDGNSTTFDGLLNDIEGIIFVINPNDISDYSIRNGKEFDMNNDENLIFSNFSSIYSNSTGTKPTEKIDVPMAVVITRCTETGLDSGLSYSINTDPSNPITEFLEENGLYNLTNEIALRFQNVRFFTTDASIGDDSSSFAPIHWIISQYGDASKWLHEVE